MLFTPERHERLGDASFSETAAREAIVRIAARAERERRDDGLWPRDAADAERAGEAPATTLYWGAAGIVWAFQELAAGEYVAAGLAEQELVEGLEARLLGDPADPDFGEEGVWFGLAGVLAVAERVRPEASKRDRLAELARASLESPALEPMLGHPGHMLVAAQLHARTGEERWAALWAEGAERLLTEWRHDPELDAWLWTQQLGTTPTRYLGAAHGLAANVHVLRQGGALLSAAQRDDVERRAAATLSRLAVVEDDRANWPPEAGDPLSSRGRIRVQWCHGAPGVLCALADVVPDDDAWSELLLAAGRLVWEAGPIRDSVGLCHGTAGSAYALLALWRRTGDELWRERARALGQHAAAQVEARAARLGHGRHSLFTGDEGVALCLASCIEGDARLPVADRLL